MACLVIAEHDNVSVRGATLNTVTAALACGGDVHILVAGASAAAAAAAAAQIAGVTKVLHADAPGLDHGLAETVAAQVVAIAGSAAKPYSHILFPATASGKNVAPRVAALLDVAQISDATKVISADTFERPIYAGNAIATVQSLDAIKVLTVRTTGFDPAAATGGRAAVESLSAVADSSISSFIGQMPHIGNVANIPNLVTQILQIAKDHIKINVATRMTQMWIAIHCGSADIHSHKWWIDRLKNFFLPTECVVYF